VSYGICICSNCKREVHQDGGPNGRGGWLWTHCEDKTPMCNGSDAIYPESRDDIRGKWCGADGLGQTL